MKTSEDEFTPGGGVAPPCTGSAADALPEVPCHHCGANSYTGVSTRNVSTLSIHPISIEPHADYPSDMKELYNFEEI